MHSSWSLLFLFPSVIVLRSFFCQANPLCLRPYIALQAFTTLHPGAVDRRLLRACIWVLLFEVHSRQMVPYSESPELCGSWTSDPSLVPSSWWTDEACHPAGRASFRAPCSLTCLSTTWGSMTVNVSCSTLFKFQAFPVSIIKEARRGISYLWTPSVISSGCQ